MDKVDQVLVHHGILGMRWGVRRQPNAQTGLVGDTSAGSKAKAGRLKEKAAASSDYAKSRELQRKAAKTLTNAEIKALNERLQLEQNLSRLNPNSLKRGETAVKAAIAVGTTASSIYALYKSPAGQALVSNLTKLTKASEEAEKMKWLL